MHLRLADGARRAAAHLGPCLPSWATPAARITSALLCVQSSGASAAAVCHIRRRYDVCRVWGPADLLCFSVPLWLRLPVRHVISFAWTAYLSFVRGANK